MTKKILLSILITLMAVAGKAQNCTLPSNLQQGLVGYWPFCGNANDESGNGNNGVVNGATRQLTSHCYTHPSRPRPSHLAPRT